MNELKSLSVEQLNELHAKLGEILNILNPESLGLSELSDKGLETALQVELIGMQVFGEMQKRLLKTK